MTLTSDVLGWIKTNWPDGSYPSDLTRVNRADSTQLEQPVRSLTDELRKSNFVGVGPGSGPRTPIGTEFTYQTTPAVSVRVVGMISNENGDEFGHIDDHAAFVTLVNNIIEAIRVEETHPTTTDPGTYHTVLIEEPTDLSDNWQDYFLATFDVRFRGYTDC